MLDAYDLLDKWKKSIDQKYHSLIEDFEKYINISKLRDDAIRNFHKTLSKVALSLPEYNADDLRLKMERIIPEVIFFNFFINLMKKLLLIFRLFLYI
jgi:hypothetical protein